MLTTTMPKITLSGDEARGIYHLTRLPHKYCGKVDGLRRALLRDKSFIKSCPSFPAFIAINGIEIQE